MNPSPEPLSSPAWQPGTRLVAGVLMLIGGALLVYALRPLLVPFVLAFLLAYLLHPLVNYVRRITRLPRGGAVAIVYGALLLALGAATTWAGLAISQQMVGLVAGLRELSAELPDLFVSLAETQVLVGPWVLDFSQINLQPALEALASAVQPLLSRTGSFLAAAAGATAQAVGLLLAVMVLGYYLLLDFGALETFYVGAVPVEYRQDFQRLFEESRRVLHAFLRGQLILGLVVGGLTAVVLLALGVRFALVLALIAGLLEFVPIFGPVLAGLLAVLVAFFQGANWLGLSPWAYAGIVLAAAVLIQQLENNIFVPRIIGHNLNIHPLVVLMAALSGGMLAGVIGILLAAPVVAILRIWLGYVYRKAVGLDTWPGPVMRPAALPDRPPLIRRILERWRLRRTAMSSGEDKP